MAHVGTEAAADSTKQIVTLSTAIIGLTVTFSEKFHTGEGAIVVHWTMKASWLAFGLSITLGVWTLMAIAGVANAAARAGAVPDADASSIRIPAILMILAFVAGIALVIWTGFVRFG